MFKRGMSYTYRGYVLSFNKKSGLYSAVVKEVTNEDGKAVQNKVTARTVPELISILDTSY